VTGSTPEPASPLSFGRFIRSFKMNNPQRTPQQEPDVSIYDPECVVNSPHIIEEWLNNIDFAPNNNDRLANGFFTLIPYYYVREDGTFPDPPEFWQRNLLSHSF